MNEFLIEDETSFYEIDPECQREQTKKREEGRKSQKRRSFPFLCEKQEKKSRGGFLCSYEWLCLLFILLICQDRQKSLDKRRSRSRCR